MNYQIPVWLQTVVAGSDLWTLLKSLRPNTWRDGGRRKHPSRVLMVAPVTPKRPTGALAAVCGDGDGNIYM